MNFLNEYLINRLKKKKKTHGNTHKCKPRVSGFIM